MRTLYRGSTIAWHDPWLLVAVGVGAAIRLSRLGDHDNSYYTATVASMLDSVHNFLFASFDPVGIVMVDKPPASFWLQAAPAAVFGVNSWSVTVPQIIMGIAAIAILYWMIGSVFGRLAAVTAALVLAVLPSSVVIDTRNEPDALVSFAVLLGALAVMKAVQTGRYRWYLMLAVLMGVAFNAKMFVAFVPLPAFFLFSIIAVNRPIREVLLRTASTVCVLLVISFLWVSLVAVTPAVERPYVGSTQNNSIWTLVFEYNGLDRFTSFIGPRRPQVPTPPLPRQGQSLYGPGGLPSTLGGYQLTGQPPINASIQETGLFGLLVNPLASQLGWLLPIGLVSLVLALLPAIPDEVYRRPGTLPKILRTTPRAAHAVLWTGWLATGLLIFGLANATTTHPYYLVGVAVPLAAVIGIGMPTLQTVFQRGNVLSWLVIVCLPAAAGYQIYGSRDYVGDWSVSIVIGMVLLSATLMVVGLGRRLHAEPMATMAFAIGAFSLLVVPLNASVNAGGRIAGPPAGMPPRATMPGDLTAQRETLLIEFLEPEGQPSEAATLLTVNAREAAPFIIAGVRAISIGGFSGNDPVFTVESFQNLVLSEGTGYFLVPNERAPYPMPRGGQQQAIIDHVSESWEDLSRTAGLPPGTLYKYPEKPNESSMP